MPRVTRAAARSNAAASSELESAASVHMPSMPCKVRAVLGEVTGNIAETKMDTSSSGTAQSKEGHACKSKNRSKREMKLKNLDATDTEEVLEDEYHSATSPAVEDACEDLRKDPEGLPQAGFCGQPCAKYNSVAEATVGEDSETNEPPVFENENVKHEGRQGEDSFTEPFGDRTPVKTSQSRTILESEMEGVSTKHPNRDATTWDHTESKEASLADQIATRSPEKPVLRIEDSVEAIDALEDEIDKRLPAITDAVSSAKAKKQRPATRNSPRESRTSVTALPANDKSQDRKPAQKLKIDQTKKATNSPCTTGQKPVRSLAKNRVSSIHKAPFQPTKSTKQPTISNFELPGDAVAKRLKVQREARLGREGEAERGLQQVVAKAAGPLKSTKPPTQASFELSGEAVARKLKEKREERMKNYQDTEVAATKRDFKSRTLRMSQPPLSKPTTTSKARISLALEETLKDSASKNGARPGSGIKGTGQIVSPDTAKRLSTLSNAERTPKTTTKVSARPSVTGTIASGMSTTTSSQRITNNGKTSYQTLRGKEVFERNKIVKSELEKQRKEKEEAAKKARAEAAERGRIASRQWAEKQKARKASAGKASEGEHVTAVAA